MKSLTRRSILGAAASTAFALPLGLGAHAWAQGGGRGIACPLCQRASFAMTGNDIANAKIAKSSGDAETDRFLGTALKRLAASFGVTPGFAFYDDHTGINAVAIRETLIGNGPGTVLMGMRLFGQLMARVRDGGVTVIAVCAHEFGHIHQMQYGYERRLGALDATNRPFELHADFLSGYYLALRKAEHSDLDLRAVGGVLHGLGDTAFNSRQHHGTPEERVAALSAGFKFGMEGGRDISAAARAGFELVQRQS